MHPRLVRARWRRFVASRLVARRTRAAAVVGATAVLCLLAAYALLARRSPAQLHPPRARREALTAEDASAIFGVGIFTAFTDGSFERRDAIFSTWLPSVARARELRLAVRFVVGEPEARSVDAARAFAAQVSPHLVLRLPGVADTYSNLASKTAAFIAAAAALWPKAQYVLKVDDDVFVRPAALPLLAARWRMRSADYVGCMKSHRMHNNAALRWAEPREMHLGGGHYFVHSWGSAYALSRRFLDAAAPLCAAHLLRLFANEDVSVGAWALALDVLLLDERRMCAQSCDEGSGVSLAVWLFNCTGLCDAPRAMRALHALPACDDAPLLLHSSPGGATVGDDDDASFFPFAVLNALGPSER